jgi:8-amino-7-oxononanoate synthase
VNKETALSRSAREHLFSRVASMRQPEDCATSGGGVVPIPDTAGRQTTAECFTDFSTLPGYQELRLQRMIGEKLALKNPYFRVSEGHPGPRTHIDGRELINFSGYDYLGFNAHPEVAEAAKVAIDRYGISASGSRHVAGERPVHRALEHALAEHYKAEDALIFVSGYATNVSVIAQLAGPKDLVITDTAVHNSAVVGSVLSGAARRSFVHNDLDNLEQILSTTRDKYERVLIVVEGLYSMDGDFPNLPRLIELKQHFHAWLMIDEAHALGTMGRYGYGIAEHFGCDLRMVDIWMGTLSKTLAGCGGYIAGSGVLVDYLRLLAGAFVYSVGMPPAIAASAQKALELLHREPSRVMRLQANGAYFQAYAKKKGLDTGPSCGLAVTPIMVGDSIATVLLSQLLFERGINVLPVMYPAVPVRTSRLRFFLTTMHSKADMETAIDMTADEMAKLPPRLQEMKLSF